MNINNAFPSKYLRAHHLNGQSAVVQITHVAIERVQQDERAVVYFLGKSKGLVLNKTNATAIAAIHGPETDLWAGRDIMLVSATTEFQGQSVPCIRIQPAPEQPNGGQKIGAIVAPAGAAPPPAPPTPAHQPISEDDIPF